MLLENGYLEYFLNPENSGDIRKNPEKRSDCGGVG